MSFRTILLTTILGLTLASTLLTTWLGATGFRSALRSAVENQIEATLDSVTGRLEDLFLPSERLTRAFVMRIRHGGVDLEDPQKLALLFADVIRYEHGIAWLSFGFPDGRFAGARMDGDQVSINLSTAGAGPPREWIVEVNGDLTPASRASLPSSFDARERIWFQMAIAEEGMIWTPPYDFASGGRGITVSEAIYGKEGELLGVVTVDFLLADIVRYLEVLRDEFRGDTIVFSVGGNLLATPRELRSIEAVQKVRDILTQEGGLETIHSDKRSLLLEINAAGTDYIVGVQAAEIPGNLDCVSIIIFDRHEALGSIERTVKRSLLAAVAALALALCVGFLLAARIANPLGQLTDCLARVGGFDLSPSPMPDSAINEVRVLSESVVRMRTSLKSFSHYVPVDLVRDLVRSGGMAELGGERRRITVLFADLAGFTAYAERVTPEEAVETLTRYFEAFGRGIDQHGGVIDKFLGDGIMALFDAPKRIESPEAAACRAALDASAALANDPAGLRVRVGLFAGEALVGNVGTSDRFTYTAIGDCVNLASRLESLNKQYGSRILAGDAIRTAAGDSEFVWRRLDCAAVVGRVDPLTIHELLGSRSSCSEEILSLASDYETAFTAFLAHDLDAAMRALSTHLEKDAPSRFLHARVAAMKADPQAPGWKGVHRFTEK